MEKIIIFGAGRFYQNRKRKIPADIQIIAIIDNNDKLQGDHIDGIPILSPEKVRQISYDKILLMSEKKNADSMKKQMLELEVEEKKIYYWEQFYKEIVRGVFKFYCGDDQTANLGKKVLIVSLNLYYTGGIISAINAALALKNRGFYVAITASTGDKKLIDEILELGINVMICPSLPILHREELFWIQQFDVILVNTFPMIKCAYEISKIRPVLWWIHEADYWYESMLNEFSKYRDWAEAPRICIYAVSGIAKRNFNRYFPNRIKDVLEIGISDENTEKIITENKSRIVFAVIGTVIPIKAQDIWLQAIALLDDEIKDKAEFLLIGTVAESEYGKKVKEYAAKEASVKIVGELTREEIRRKYADIDVVVCSSLQETMSLTIIEGMMYGKVCLAPDTAGIADYIEDGKNGFIFKAGDYVQLAKKMRWIIEHKEELDKFRERARKIYEEYFTIDKFADKLEKAVIGTIEKYNIEGN